MSKDIRSILEGWDHDPDEPQVRIIPGDDGRDKLQVRLDLGLLQMELDGRPDGERPHGYESLLDYHEARHAAAVANDEPFHLDQYDCVGMWREGVQYYHRYVALFRIQRYDLVVRDTARNLRLFAFAVANATRAQDKVQFDQYRPYVILMHTRAAGFQSLERSDYGEALDKIDEGIAAIRGFLNDYDESANEAQCQELNALLDWRRQVERERPMGPVERLEQQLDLAVAREEFEEAARLRDQLRRIRDTPGLGSTSAGPRQG